MCYIQFIQAALQKTVDHRQLPERNRLRALVGKKLFTRKESILKLPELRDLVTSNCFIQLHLNFIQNFDTQETCIHHIRV